MSWLTKFFSSSIGNKFLMSLTGLFLCLFLVVHLAGNLQLLINDGGESFNAYVKVMESNLLIKVIAYGLYLAILAHTYKGVVIYLQNRKARGSVRYAVKSTRDTTWASRNMIWLGSLLFVFIAIHMSQFWYRFKFTHLEETEFYTVVDLGFQQAWIVIFYVLGQVVLAWHLVHGFQSAFQTIGWRNGKYTKLLQNLGLGFAILIPFLFAIIPVLMFYDIHPFPEFKVIPGQ